MNLKEPDKHRVLKIPLKNILKPNMDVILNDAIIRTNKLVIHVYQFLRLWILHKHKKLETIPLITKEIIHMSFKALMKPTKRGRKPTGNNLMIFNEFNEFYENNYKNLGYPERINGKNLSSIIDYQLTDILTNIENNIKLNFDKYINKYVNASFYINHKMILDKLKGTEKIHMRKQLQKELSVLKKDLMNNTVTCDTKYKQWLKVNRHIILPKKYNESYYRDVIHNPQKYIPYMIKMNEFLEKEGLSQFQFFPLRTSLIPKYCMLDTKSLIELFVKNKTDYLSDILNKKKEIWETIFNMNNSVFKRNKYTFDYNISTDGYAVSINFINNDNLEKHNNEKAGKTKARKESIKIKKNMTEDEKQLFNELKDKQKKDNKEKQRLYAKDKRDKFKQLSKEEQQSIKNKNKKQIEFPYFEDLTETELLKLSKTNKAYIDPGKRDLIYMKGDNGNTFKYSNKQKLKETKQLKYARLLNNLINTENTNVKNSLSISSITNGLTYLRSKTCDLEKFKNYITYKNIMADLKLYNFYQNIKFRQYKWYYYINKTKSQANLLNTIEKKFGKDTIIIYGDWSIGHQMRNFMSTPMISLKRTIATKFTVYNIDEFRTSCLNSKTETVCQNLILPDKRNKLREIHSILTYEMKNKRIGCINRDLNSVNNMRKLTDYYLKTRSRPLKYQRCYDVNGQPIKVTNPNNKPSGRRLICASASNGIRHAQTECNYTQKINQSIKLNQVIKEDIKANSKSNPERV